MKHYLKAYIVTLEKSLTEVNVFLVIMENSFTFYFAINFFSRFRGILIKYDMY